MLDDNFDKNGCVVGVACISTITIPLLVQVEDCLQAFVCRGKVGTAVGRSCKVSLGRKEEGWNVSIENRTLCLAGHRKIVTLNLSLTFIADVGVSTYRSLRAMVFWSFFVLVYFKVAKSRWPGASLLPIGVLTTIIWKAGFLVGRS